MDQKLAEQVLKLIDRDLRGKLLPELKTPSAQLQVDYMSRLLRWLSVHINVSDIAEAQYGAELSALLTESGAERGDVGLSAFDRGDVTPDASMNALRSLGASQGSEARAQLLRYVDLESRLVKSLDPEGGRGFSDIYLGGRLGQGDIEALPTPITADTLTTYLRQQVSGYGNARAANVRPLPGGFGKDTILFDIDVGEAPSEQVVMRKDFLVPPGPGSVTNELPLLRHLLQAQLPVPEPLWAESDPTIFGGAFIVVRRLPGSTDVGKWSADPELCRHFADRLAQILARIHSFTPASMGRADLGDLSAGNVLRDHMRSFYDHYRARTSTIHPRIEVAFSWLFEHLPPVDPAIEPVLIHGDFGFHNILIDGAEVTAVLDWEFVHFGDPTEDLSYCRQFVERLLPWADFLNLYQRHGGRVTTNQFYRCFQVWGDLRNACMGVGAVGTLAISAMPDMRSAVAGLGFGALCELQALRNIVA